MRLDIFVMLGFAGAAVYFASQGRLDLFGICFVLWAIAALISLKVSRSGSNNDRDQK